MKRLSLIFGVLLIGLHVQAQAVRWSGNAYTINTMAPQPGALYPVLSNTSAKVSVCNYSATVSCPSLATTYTNAAESASCPTSAQLTQKNSAACSASVDAQGNWGVWIAAGTYQVVITAPNGTFGPFPFTAGGTGGGGSGPTLQTNGTNNASQATLNFVNPASFNGLNIVFSNPTGGNETFALSGTLNNTGLTNSSTNVNGQTCTLGSTCTITTSFPTGTTNQLLYYATSGNTLTPVSLGSNLSITSAVLNAANPTFTAIQSGTNLAAAMVCGTGCSLAPTGGGTIQATNIASTITAGSNVTITGSGTTSSPYNISSSGGGGGSAFNALTSGTNTSAAMVVGSGATLTPTGTGAIQATNIASTIVAGSNITISGAGTVASPYSITSTSTGATAFSALTSATNTSAAMVVGAGASLNYTSSGTINASSVGGVALSGLCQTGGTGCPQLPITIAPTSHEWINSYTSSTGVFTVTQPAFSDISGQATLSQLPNGSSNSVLLGYGASGSGSPPVQISLGSGLTMTGTTLSATGGGSGLPCSGSCSTSTIAMFGSGGTSVTNSHLDESSLAGVDTFSQPVNVSDTADPTTLGLTYNAGHAPGVGSSTTALFAVGSAGQAEVSEAGAAQSRICTAANGATCVPHATSSSYGTVELGLPGAVNITSLLTWTGCTPTGTPATQCIVGTPAVPITASGIPGTYSQIVIVGTLNNTTANAGSFYVQWNGDTGSNYSTQQTYSSDTTFASAGTGTITNADIAGMAGTGAGSAPSTFNMICPAYAGTTWYKNCFSNSMRWASAGQIYIQNYASSWASTAAITSFAMYDTFSTSDTFATGSTFSVYGLP